VTTTTGIWVWTSKNGTTVHTKTQHGSDIYRVLGLHRRHGFHEFATSFRVRDKESMQRSIAELNRIHEGWGMAKDSGGEWKNARANNFPVRVSFTVRG
jgi:hypothetical protein